MDLLGFCCSVKNAELDVSVMNKAMLGAVALFAGASSYAASPTICQTSRPKSKSYGVVSRTECSADGIAVSDSVNLNGVVVLSDVQLFPEDSNNTGSIRIYASGASNPKTGCPSKLYLLDLNVVPSRAIAFGIKGACNEFHWASWGDKRSVIALKSNVSFVYENGKLTPPLSGESLFKAIEPPHAGSGITEKDAVGFVEQMPLPK